MNELLVRLNILRLTISPEVCSFMLCDLDFEPLSLSLSSMPSCDLVSLTNMLILLHYLESFKSELAEYHSDVLANITMILRRTLVNSLLTPLINSLWNLMMFKQGTSELEHIATYSISSISSEIVNKITCVSLPCQMRQVSVERKIRMLGRVVHIARSLATVTARGNKLLAPTLELVGFNCCGSCIRSSDTIMIQKSFGMKHEARTGL
ncbi:hypothetical protein Tco_1360527 [Tanacetum coccineum]